MIKRGYELIYNVEMQSKVGTYIEDRKVFLEVTDFEEALDIAQTIKRETEMDEICSVAKIISLTPKAIPGRLKND